jgi:hypothetical protein
MKVIVFKMKRTATCYNNVGILHCRAFMTTTLESKFQDCKTKDGVVSVHVMKA